MHGHLNVVGQPRIFRTHPPDGRKHIVVQVAVPHMAKAIDPRIRHDTAHRLVPLGHKLRQAGQRHRNIMRHDRSDQPVPLGDGFADGPQRAALAVGLGDDGVGNTLILKRLLQRLL